MILTGRENNQFERVCIGKKMLLSPRFIYCSGIKSENENKREQSLDNGGTLFNDYCTEKFE